MTAQGTPRTKSAFLEPGTVVAGKLEVVRRLGEGGMGAVYEVVHQLTKHHRAMKVLHPEAGAKPQLVKRFLREASAAGRIGNAHIAETFDAGTLANGEPFLVMELLEGETLAARIARGPLDAAELADYAIQACDGIMAAHQAGIIHRDLKPENLFITRRDGRAFLKILDFGVSKFQETESARGLTSDGALVGTPFYMPPEQLEGRGVDERADVYALGVILYECAARKRPFEAATLPHLAVLIHEAKPTPLAALRPDLPAELIAAISRAMHPDPEARFASALPLADAIAASLPEPPARAFSSAPPDVPTLLSDAPGPLAPISEAPSSEVALSHSRVAGTRNAARWLLVPAAAALALMVWFKVSGSREEKAVVAGTSTSIAASMPLPLPLPLPTPVPPAALPSEPASSGPPQPLLSAAPKKQTAKRRQSEQTLKPPGSAVPQFEPPPVSVPARTQKPGLETNNPYR